MRSEEPPEALRHRARRREPRPFRVNEEAVDLAAEEVGFARVRGTRVSGGPRGAREPRLFDPAPACREARAVEEARLVEARREGGDVLQPRRLLAMSDRDDAVDLGHGVLPVEQRDDVERWNGQENDLLGEAGRVAERDEPLAVLLHRERFERPETGTIPAVH
jgi:hypothetical protein